MKVKFLDKNVSGFLKCFTLIILVLSAGLAALMFIYKSSSLKLYGILLVVSFALLAVLFASALVSAASLIYTYKNKRLPKILMLPFSIGLKILLPLMVSFSYVFKGENDVLRRFYIENNNIFTESLGRRFKREEVLVLLPHCLQNSGCDIRITKDINLCRECGKCPIKDIVGILRETGVRAAVTTGGTAARKAIRDQRPKAVLAVACERDLVSGLADTGRLPVIGIVNIRPNGPCSDTFVDMELLRSKLEGLLGINS